MDDKLLKHYNKILYNCSENLIKEDGNELLKILQSQSYMVLLELIPYIALYCREVQEFYGVNILDKETDDMIFDLRNGIKLFSNKFNYNKKIVLNADKNQDEYFKDKLRFSFMKNWNIHNNLGIYFDGEGHIVGNTQYIDSYLNIYTQMSDEEKNQLAFEVGRRLGDRVGYIFTNLFSENILLEKSDIDFPSYGYIDFNTNRKNDFWDIAIDKGLNLMVLHLVSTVGFIEHIIGASINNTSNWFVRIEYITAHYAWLSMKKIKQHYDMEEMAKVKFDGWKELIAEGKYLFPSDFRNCMMHYGLFNHNEAVIKVDKFDNNIPFFGLVESCFHEKTYDLFLGDLRNFILRIENQLLQWFHINKNKIKWD